MNLLDILWRGFLLGLSVAAPVGPINIEIIRRGLSDRPAAGLGIGLGACTIDALYILVAGFGLSFILQATLAVLVLYLAGAALLTWMAFGALRAGTRQLGRAAGPGAEIAPAAATSFRRAYVTGLAMTASSPFTIVFWTSVPAKFFGGTPPPLATILLTGASVLVGTLCWVGFLNLLVAFGRRFVHARFLAWLNIAGGAMLAAFAIWFWYGGVVELLRRT